MGVKDKDTDRHGRYRKGVCVAYVVGGERVTNLMIRGDKDEGSQIVENPDGDGMIRGYGKQAKRGGERVGVGKRMGARVNEYKEILGDEVLVRALHLSTITPPIRFITHCTNRCRPFHKLSQTESTAIWQGVPRNRM
jgi:hypothetical protein